MAELTLEVSRRERTGKEIAKKLRAAGKVPAIVYGGHKDPVAIEVDRKIFSEMLSKAEHGVRSIFLLKMSDSDQKRHAMVKDIQIDPVSRKMTHIDFVRVAMDEAVRVTIPVHLTGTPVGVKTGGGIVDFQVRELHVECLPNAIPDTFDVDVTSLDVHHSIRISDLPIPEGVKILDDPDRVVASVTLARHDATTDPAAEAAGTEPELIKKGKGEEDEKK